MLRRLSNTEVIAQFGDPTKYLTPTGDPDGVWKVAILGKFSLPAPLPLAWDAGIKAKTISCHRLVVDELRDIFVAIHANPAAWSAINDYGGCYNWRTNRNNPKALSRHCWGIAVDLDVKDNPNKGGINMHPFVVECFAAKGWIWGGDKRFFPTPDGMHFEKGAL